MAIPCSSTRPADVTGPTRTGASVEVDDHLPGDANDLALPVSGHGTAIDPIELLPGDLIRDQGVLRTVARTEQLGRDGRSVVIFFVPRDGYTDRLRAIAGYDIFALRAADPG